MDDKELKRFMLKKEREINEATELIWDVTEGLSKEQKDILDTQLMEIENLSRYAGQAYGLLTGEEPPETR